MKLFNGDLYFFKLIKQNFDITDGCIYQKKYSLKLEYEDLYNKLINDKKIVENLQNQLIEKRACEIKKYFKKPFNNNLADLFMRRLYCQDLRKPINKQFIDTCKKIYID